jgi:hypothetical protein
MIYLAALRTRNAQTRKVSLEVQAKESDENSNDLEM